MIKLNNLFIIYYLVATCGLLIAWLCIPVKLEVFITL